MSSGARQLQGAGVEIERAAEAPLHRRPSGGHAPPHSRLVAAALLASLLALELAARLWLGPVIESNVTAVPQSLLVDSPYPGLRFRPRPNGCPAQEFPSDPRGYFGPGKSVEYALNSLGLRGPEVARAKPEVTIKDR